MKKICTKCNKEKELEEFYNSKTGKYGKMAICKLCDNWRKTTYLRNKSSGNKCNTLDARANRINDLKYCPKCKQTKDIKEFYKTKHNKGRASQCIECSKDIRRNIPKKQIHGYYMNRKEKQWENKLIRNFGINATEYYKLLKQQNNKCAICKNEYKEGNKKLAVDHCHKTGKIRGLLCSNCNPALGFLKEDLNIIKNLVRYIKNKGV